MKRRLDYQNKITKVRRLSKRTMENVIRRVCGQTLELGLGKIRYSSSIIISL